jgi:CRISPR/Cas system-associated exonuclease Cas4 (RecB family)
MLEKTTELLKTKNIIFEATFSGNGGFAMLDILVKNANKWDIYEVKSSTSIKKNHIIDSSYQRFVASKDINIGDNYIIYINNKYTRGDNLNIDKLFTINNITDKVLAIMPSIHKSLKQQQDILKGDEPQTIIKKKCTSCEYKNYCFYECLSIPKQSVFNLYNCRNKIKWYNEGKIKYSDVLGEYLNPVQLAQIANKEIINPTILKDFINKITYPIYFFDFETFQDAVPRFKGQKPYAQMPFQYSLHILTEDEKLQHFEFLAKCDEDPRVKIAQNMLKNLGKSGTIMAFNQSFEIGRIKELAKFAPEYKDELLALIPRFADLIIPFRKLGYYHPNMNGSFSLKSVLPAMFKGVDELDYKKLGSVQNGGDAMNIFANLHLESNQEKIQKVRNDLLKYCHLDTFSMVKIWQKLIILAKS